MSTDARTLGRGTGPDALSLGAARALAVLHAAGPGDSVASLARRAGLRRERAAHGLRELFHCGLAEPTGAHWRLTELGAEHRRTLGWR